MIASTSRRKLVTSLPRDLVVQRRQLQHRSRLFPKGFVTLPRGGGAPSTAAVHQSSLDSRCFESIWIRKQSTAAAAVAAKAKPPAAKDDNKNSNVFLDNLGTVFLAGIGLIIVSLVRSYRGSTNRNQTREKLEQQASLDPLEIDDLRVANSELTLPVYREILQNLHAAYPESSDATIPYADFVRSVRTTMKALKGDAFTVELGHLLDRVVVDALHRHKMSTEDAQPVAFWMTVLSLALAAPVPDRIRALFEVLQHTTRRREDDDDATSETAAVTLADTRTMVGYLQDTCQVTLDSQVVETSQKYPVQQYERGNLGQLFEWEGSEDEALDIDAFASILRSRAVCVWGECYHKRKIV